MKKIVCLILSLFAAAALFAGSRNVEPGNSYTEFPTIVIVGQVVEVDPFKVVIENTYQETFATTDRVRAISDYFFTSTTDYSAHGFAMALKAVTIEKNRMRMTMYADNIFQIFDDDVSTYMRYIPLLFLYKDKIKDMNLPKETIEMLNKIPVDYFLNNDIVKDLMNNVWIAGVFRINPQNKKLIFQSGQIFENFEQMDLSGWASEYRIPDIVRSGLVVSMTKQIIIGNEANHPDEGNGKGLDINKNRIQNRKGYNNRKEIRGGTVTK